MKLHNFTHSGWGNSLLNSGACWSRIGAVVSDDFIKTDNTWYKILEAKPCVDPKDMSFIKKYVSLVEEERGDVVTVDILEKIYQENKNTRTIWEFPLDKKAEK